MPAAYARARLPGAFKYFVGRSALHVPYKAFLLLVGKYLAEHHGLKPSAVRSHVVIIEVCGDFQPRVAERIERHAGDVEVKQVGIIPVDYVERAVVEVGAKLLRRHICSPAPRPLAVYCAVVPAVLAQRMVLRVKVLRVVAFPPFALAVGRGELAVIRNTLLRPFQVVPLRRLVERPGVVGVQAYAEAQPILARRPGPFVQYVALRPHVYRVPRLVLAVPKVHVIMVVAEGEEILRAYLLIESHEAVRVPLLGFPHRYYVLEAHFGGMAVMPYVMVVLA